MNSKRQRNRNAKKNQNNEEEKKHTLVGTFLQLPETSISNMAQIDLMSNREALIEGCKGVVEYNEDYIRLNLGNMGVRFCGRSLQLRSMNEECVIVEGFIQSIEFLT